MGIYCPSQFIRTGGPADKRWEDGQNDLQTVSGSRNPIGGSVQTEDYGGGDDITGTTEGAGRVWGMRGGDGGGVADIPPDDTLQTGKGRSVELGNLGHGRPPANVLAGLPDQGRAEELPCGRLTRKGWDADINAEAFLQPECLGHRDNLGGGKPPTPKVLAMRHAGPVAGTQR